MNDQSEGEGSSDFSRALLHWSRYGMGVRKQLLDLVCSPASSALHSDQQDRSPGSLSLSRDEAVLHEKVQRMASVPLIAMLMSHPCWWRWRH